jgi:hypothetical protein
MPSKFKISLSFILTLLMIGLVGLNLLYAGINILSKIQNRKPIYAPGAQFEDIKALIKDEKAIGYLTNRDISPEKNDQEFLLAQYTLAPTILDVNNDNHRILLLDYTNPTFMIYKLKEIQIKPAYSNKYDKVLAVRRP